MCWSRPRTCQITFQMSTSRASIHASRTTIVISMVTAAAKKTTVTESEMMMKMIVMKMMTMTAKRTRTTTDYKGLKSECTATLWSSRRSGGWL